MTDTRPGWRERLGLLRSLAIYWRPGRQRGLRELYRPYIRPGDVAFDIGAHVGDRMIALADLGARVIAVEPQPHLHGWLRWLARRRGTAITLVTAAVGADIGRVELAINARNPTVSSASADWRTRVQRYHPGFHGQRWSRTVTVPVTTLADLIARHGEPAFCKIDVEGFEAEVLRGLDRPLPALSFEFVAGTLDTACAAVERLEELGVHEYNMIVGEQRRYAWSEWRQASRVTAWLDQGADDIPSGDLYARRLPDPAIALRAE